MIVYMIDSRLRFSPNQDGQDERMSRMEELIECPHCRVEIDILRNGINECVQCRSVGCLECIILF